MLGGGAGRFCAPSSTTGPFRLFAVSGFQNRTNDIVYCPPILKNLNENEDDSTAIIYFGGDVQVIYIYFFYSNNLFIVKYNKIISF